MTDVEIVDALNRHRDLLAVADTAVESIQATDCNDSRTTGLRSLIAILERDADAIAAALVARLGRKPARRPARAAPCTDCGGPHAPAHPASADVG